jgi:hypothetical protein
MTTFSTHDIPTQQPPLETRQMAESPQEQAQAPAVAHVRLPMNAQRSDGSVALRRTARRFRAGRDGVFPW